MKWTHPLDKLVAYSLKGGLPVLLLLLSFFLGAIALQYTAREEEPQIVVPMVDVQVDAPGLSVKQVERQVTIPLEKLLAQIPGVENVYSSSLSGKTSVTLRFYVGENREDAILNTYNKLYSNQDKVPKVVTNWIVQPREIDDVPIVMLALWSDHPDRTSDFELRRLAEEISTSLQSIKNTSEVRVTGGRPRTIRILPQPESLSARQSTTADIVHSLQVSNVLTSAGYWSLNSKYVQLEAGDVLRTVDELKQTVVNVVDGQPVLLQDVANIIDGPAEPDSYSWIDFSEKQSSDLSLKTTLPMVTISVAKQRGSNAVSVARNVHQKMAEIQRNLFPDDVHIEVLRDYGQTANEKVDDLSTSLVFAVFTVVVFIAVFLGWRSALVVGLAIPVSYGFTLFLDMAFGYTINRVTLFALILSLGLLVDDPITGIDNIERFLKSKKGELNDTIVSAISEIKVPLVMASITIILAFIPLAFITGMMGPYMAPMAFNVPVSIIMSTLVAFVVTPWLSAKLLAPQVDKLNSNSSDFDETCSDKASDEKTDSPLLRIYQKILQPLLDNRRKAKAVLWVVLVLFIAAAMLPVMRSVPLKLLPYDNKNEIQIVIDMPESTTLEQTAALAQKVSQIARQMNEVDVIAAYVGQPSPIDFNGLVRHYYQRNEPYLADLRLKLIDKTLREQQSHGVVLRLRTLLVPLNKNGVNIKVVEVPPGPPVMSTLVAELYGSTLTPYPVLQRAAMRVKERLEREAFVTEVDTSVGDDQYRLRFITDKQKAALSGISTADISQTLIMANQGINAGYLQQDREAKPLPLLLRLPLPERASITDLKRLQVKGQAGIVKQNTREGLENGPQPLVALGELGVFKKQISDKPIYRKDLNPVVYVTAEVSGRTPGEIIADVNGDLGKRQGEASDWHDRNFLNLLAGQAGAGDGWNLPKGVKLRWSGEGEWKITVDVFRDMGFAFMFALVGIFVVLKLQTGSISLALIIMSSIPLTIIGIMPGFALLNHVGERVISGAPDPVLFTATAMIGMIALAGIVVRNSLILIEFITQARNRGMAIKEALLQAGAMRMRPILLTAGTTLLGNLVITLDPVFSGLALAIIFGIIASTVLTLIVVPVVYLLVFDKPEKES